jgi:hypothetical protein
MSADSADAVPKVGCAVSPPLFNELVLGRRERARINEESEVRAVRQKLSESAAECEFYKL